MTSAKPSLLRAKETLGDWELAGRAVRFNLEQSSIRARCETFYYFHQEPQDDTDDPLPKKWCDVCPEFWPGSTIDWGQNFANMNGWEGRRHENINPKYRYFAAGVLVHRDDVEKLWPVSRAAASGSPSSPTNLTRPNPPPSTAALTAFIVSKADGRIKIAELKKLARDHFSESHISDDLWDNAKNQAKKEGARILPKGRPPKSGKCA